MHFHSDASEDEEPKKTAPTPRHTEHAASQPAFYPPPAEVDLAAKPWLPPPPRSLTFVNANIVDPAASKVLKGMTLKVKGGLVVSLEKTRHAKDLQDDLSDVIDASGWYLTPGLIDGHVHLTAVNGYGTIAGSFHAERDEVLFRSTWNIKQMLSRGYTTCRDVGGATKAFADATADGLIPGPRIFQGGPLISQTGGHGDGGPPFATATCCGGGGGFGSGLSRVADGVDACLVAARDAMRRGADHIKVCTSGGVGSVTDKLTATQFTIEELQAITTTVKNMGGTLVTSHCYTSEGIRHAIASGVGGIEHGNLLDKPTAELMAEKGIFLTPTLAVHGLIGSPAWRKFLLPSQIEKNELVRTQGLKALKIADEAGVTVCLGSDMLGAQGPYQTNEFVVRASVLPSPTVLKHATINAARMLGMEGKIGILTPGAFADILIMKSNPLEDVTIFDRWHEEQLCVIKEGRVMKSKIAGLKAEVNLD